MDDIDSFVNALLAQPKSRSRKTASFTPPAPTLSPDEIAKLAPPATHEGVRIIMPPVVLPEPFDPKLRDPDPNFYIADGPVNGFAYAIPQVTVDPKCRYHGKQPGVDSNVVLGPLTNGRIRHYELAGNYGYTAMMAARYDERMREQRKADREFKQKRKQRQKDYVSKLATEILMGL